MQKLFSLLSKLSPFALARYQTMVGAELGIKAREFNRLLRAA